MEAREFIKKYQVTSGKDWMVDKEDVLVKLLEEYKTYILENSL